MSSRPRPRPDGSASEPAANVPAVAAAGVAAAVIALDTGGGTVLPAGTPKIQVAAVSGGPNHAPAVKGHAVLYRLASESHAEPALTGRYAILTETDTQSDEPGQVSKRTSVDDTQTGASITYQIPYAGTGAPSQLRAGPDAQQTAAYYASLPTDPTALRSALLAIGKLQSKQGEPPTNAALPSSDGPNQQFSQMPSDDDLVYEQANNMLWSPIVSPALRSALYKVLAGCSGYWINQNATDPSGRPAIAMTWTETQYGTTDTDITYEDPQTGAVLAQAWKTGTLTINAIYQPATSSGSIPADPYGD
jgi:hypothetical protein